MKVLPWLLIILAGLYIASDLLGSPDTTEADAAREEAAQAHARADSAALEALKARTELEDSIARWKTERARSDTIVRVEVVRHAADADSVRAKVDSATAVIVDRMEQGFAVALDAERQKTETWKAEANALRVQLSIVDREVVALRNTIAKQDTESLLLRAALEEQQPSTIHKVGDVLAWGYTGTQLVRAVIGVASPS